MQFIELVSSILELDFCTVTAKNLVAPSREISSVRVFEGAAPDFLPDVLYICSADHFNAGPLPAGTLNLIFCGAGTTHTLPLSAEGTNLLFLDGADLLPLLYDRLRRLLSPRKPEEAEKMQRLTDALLSGKGLQHLVDTAAAVCGNPVQVSGLDNRYLTRSAAFPEAEAAPDPSILHSDSTHGCRQQFRKRALTIAYPVLVPAAPGTAEASALLEVPILIQNIVAGYCSLHEARRPFTWDDYALLHYFSKLLSVEFQKDRYFMENKGTLYAYLMRDLLSDNIVDPKIVQQRLHALGWNPKECFCVLAIGLRNLKGLSVNPGVIAKQLHDLVGQSLYALAEDTIALLLTLDRGKQPDFKKLQSYLQEMNLFAGISPLFTDIMETGRHYRTALRISVLGGQLDPEKKLYPVSDYVIYTLLQKQDRTFLLDSLAGGAIRLLQEQDRQYNSQLLPTLRQWFSSNMVTSPAAQALHIHKNTLLFRLDRIRQITGLTLRDSEELLQLMLALKLTEFS